MALADSVPGVSGGTIAFILGFYDRFLDSLHALFGKDRTARKDALCYLAKLGTGWSIGMIACVLVLSGLIEKNIYFMSSLFLGQADAAGHALLRLPHDGAVGLIDGPVDGRRAFRLRQQLGHAVGVAPTVAHAVGVVKGQPYRMCSA